MFKNLKQKITNFFESDLRWKLIKLTKYTHIKFYPDFFSRTGIQGLYSRIIIHFLFNEQIKKIKKNITNDFFNYDSNDKLNFLISSPSSGSNFTRNMLQSYFELFYELGDGVPKYDNVNARLFFSGSQIDPAAMYNHVHVLHHIIDKNVIMNKKLYREKKIIFSRYPLGPIDLYKFHQIKPVILFRDPFEEISSVYVKYDRRPEEIKLKEINQELLVSKIKIYEKYINFWSKFASQPENKNKFMVINYQDLVENSEVVLEKILVFYDYKINNEFVKKSAFIHSKENTMKNLWSPKLLKKKGRFSDPEIKKEQQKLIKQNFEKILSETNIIRDYNYLKSIS
jgi:hypothetical protein